MNVVDIISKQAPHLSWIKDHLIYLCIHGSKAYNCHVESSDDDYKGVTCLPKKYLYGFNLNFEQAELKDPNPDTVIFSILKYFNLASSANPNILETLFVKPEHQLYVHPLIEKIIDKRDIFLSKKIRFSFGGFAYSQMKRTKLHRSWLLKPIAKPSREEFGLPPQPEIGQENLNAAMAFVNKELDKFNFNFMHNLSSEDRIMVKNAVEDMLCTMKIYHEDMFKAITKKISFDDNLVRILQKEREYSSKLEDWKKYNNWLENRNEKRAQDEAKYGYDLKFGYHIVRLFKTAKELLETGKLNVYREDREEIMKVRRGEWTFDQLDEFTEKSDKELQHLYETSNKLPNSPNINELNSLCQEIVEQGINMKGI
jgi:predicted nucleotidyltransferase